MRAIHPLIALREEHGIGRREFAQVAGCGYSTVTHCELGIHADLSPSVRRGIERLGGNGDVARAEYLLWRGQQVKEGPAP